MRVLGPHQQCIHLSKQATWALHYRQGWPNPLVSSVNLSEIHPMPSPISPLTPHPGNPLVCTPGFPFFPPVHPEWQMKETKIPRSLSVAKERTQRHTIFLWGLTFHLKNWCWFYLLLYNSHASFNQKNAFSLFLYTSVYPNTWAKWTPLEDAPYLFWGFECEFDLQPLGSQQVGIQLGRPCPVWMLELYIFAQFLLLGVPSFLEVKNFYLYFNTHLKCYLLI